MDCFSSQTAWTNIRRYRNFLNAAMRKAKVTGLAICRSQWVAPLLVASKKAPQSPAGLFYVGLQRN